MRLRLVTLQYQYLLLGPFCQTKSQKESENPCAILASSAKDFISNEKEKISTIKIIILSGTMQSRIYLIHKFFIGIDRASVGAEQNIE